MRKEIKENYKKLCQKFPLINIDEHTEYLKKYQYTDAKGQTWLLRDGVDVERSVSVWCDQFQRVVHNTVFFVFGIGTIEYIQEMKRRFPDHIMIFFEPCEENIVRLAMEDGLEQLRTMENIIIIAGEGRFRHLEEALYSIVRYENMSETRYAVLPNYAKIWEDEYQQFVSICKYANAKRLMDRNTLILNQDTMVNNYLYHLKRCTQESDLQCLKDVMPEEIVEDYPAIIIAAGPSLDKNIEQLLEYHGRAFVICVDAALNPTLQRGVIPDIVVSVDTVIKKVKALESEVFSYLPMVITMNNSREMVETYAGRLFYDLDEDAYTRQIISQDTNQGMTMESGGSVANNAFSLARILGFKHIILIGQDLAYPDNKRHASGAFENEEELNAASNKYFYVDDIYGGKVLTETNMNMYREWFEKRIENYKEIEVIDATEGGALIKGTKIMTLQDALKEYCPKQKMDFKSRINSAEYLCDEEKRKKAEEELQKLPQKIDAIRERMQSARKIYEKLDQLNRKGKYQSKEFKNCVKNIEQFTHYMDTVPEVQLLVRLVYKDSYEMRETIEKDEENIYADIKKIVDSGLKMIDAYTDAGEKMKEYLETNERGHSDMGDGEYTGA